MGLEAAGITVGRDGIQVDEYLQTGVPGVWAVGDVIGPYRFTHMADIQGRAVLRNIMFPWRKRKIDYRVVPWATFTDPEVGHVGLTEGEVRKVHRAGVSTVHLPLSRVDRAVADGATEGFIKLVLRGQTILGVQVVAPRAAELVQEVALAMQHRLPLSALSMVHIYGAHLPRLRLWVAPGRRRGLAPARQGRSARQRCLAPPAPPRLTLIRGRRSRIRDKTTAAAPRPRSD